MAAPSPSARVKNWDALTKVCPQDHYVCLWVADTGTGMDAETLKRAGEPFFTTKGLGRGTGLGLSMVYGLAAQLQGSLLLKSWPGAGTTAEIWLPATQAAVAEAEAEISQPHAATGPLEVLAVDDDLLVLDNVAAMLEDLGHKVTTARSGQEALGVLGREGKFDLLITDHAMPEMTGLQLAERAAALRPALRIILATGYAELPAGQHTDLPRLGKPFDQTILAKSIAAAMQGKARGSLVAFRPEAPDRTACFSFRISAGHGSAADRVGGHGAGHAGALGSPPTITTIIPTT
jgi:CheY-like chemotaxis protein